MIIKTDESQIYIEDEIPGDECHVQIGSLYSENDFNEIFLTEAQAFEVWKHLGEIFGFDALA
jgi:hypothetical protein